MPKFRGHLFNWHDTRTLEPLSPQYVSTVDSGNLAGHLLALKQACVDLSERPLFGAHTLAGLGDTIALLRLEVERMGASRKRTEVVTVNHLREEITACAALVSREPPDSLSGWESLFNSLHRHASTVDDMLAALAQEHGSGDFTEAGFWAGALLRQVKEFARDLRAFAPTVYTRDSHLSRVLSSGLAAPGLRPELAHALERVESLSRASEVYDAALTDLSARAYDPAHGAAEQGAVLGGEPTLTTAIEDAAAAVTSLLVAPEPSGAAVRGACSRGWTSVSSSTRSARSSASATTSPPDSPTTLTTTCWPRSRASRASSPSPKATRRRSIGFTWAAS